MSRVVALFVPVVNGWRFLMRQGGLLTNPLSRRDYVVIGVLIALEFAVGKWL